MAQLGLRRYLGVVEIVGSNPAAPIPRHCSVSEVNREVNYEATGHERTK